MGTHPIFESDFDCLTDLLRAGMGKISSECVQANGMHVNGHCKEPKQVFLCQSRNLRYLFSKIRHTQTDSKDFAFYATRLMKLIAEDALSLLATAECDIPTPCGVWPGVDCEPTKEAFAISIVRAGDSMLEVQTMLYFRRIKKLIVRQFAIYVPVFRWPKS